MTTLSRPLGFPGRSRAEWATLAVLELANADVYRVTRERTVQRSHDPSEYTIVAFGGVGPMCATDVAGGLDAPRVSVSPSPGIVPARRLLTADVKYDSQVTLGRDIADVEAETVERQFEEPGQWSRNRRQSR